MKTPCMVLALVCGTPAMRADVFSWSPLCGNEDWWGACSNGLGSPDCIFFNNWGRSRNCDLGLPPFPGPADDVDGGGAPIRLEHSFAHIRSFQIGGPFAFIGGSMKVETEGEFFGPVTIENAHFAGGDFTFHGPIEFPPFGQFVVSDPGTLHIRGPLHWHEAANNFRIDSGAHVIIEDTGHFEINGDGHLNTIIAAASFTNRGMINKHGPDSLMGISVTFTNEGTFNVHSGGLNFTGSGNVFGGMMHLNSTVGMFINAPSSTADAFVLMGEGPCTVTSSLTIHGDAMIRRLTLQGDLDVPGALFTEELTQLSGTITLAGGSIESPMPVRLNAGSLRGDGLLRADLEVAGGTVSPGTSIGQIAIGGPEPRNYTQLPSGTLRVEVGGAPGEQCDRVLVSGEATLAGVLLVTFADGYTPAPGDDFTILIASAIHGRFDVEAVPFGMNVEYGSDSVRIVVPGCPGDLTGASDPNDGSYGVPDGAVDAADFFYFLDQFALGNLAAADLTGTSDPNDPGYGVPDGALDAADFFYYLDLFVAGCP